jgi:hypothetical protein
VESGKRVWIRTIVRNDRRGGHLLVVLLILRWPRAGKNRRGNPDCRRYRVVRVAPFAITVSAIGTVEPQPGRKHGGRPRRPW